jgi:alpha-ketoglutarate-dependent taurine dioxygenase
MLFYGNLIRRRVMSPAEPGTAFNGDIAGPRGPQIGRVGEQVRLALPLIDTSLPIPVFEASADGLDLAIWVEYAQDYIRSLLCEYGAVLVRGMSGARDGFAISVRRIGEGDLLDYSNRSTPRSRVDGNVFTSTEYPSDQVIPQHGEQAYTSRWPLVLGFFCEVAARSGGETPLASAAEVLRSLPQELVARFRDLGVQYERWFHPHLGLPWSEVFQTADPAKVGEITAAAGIDATWFDGGILRTRERAQGVIEHPVTGVQLWFNQAHLFHPASLSDKVRHGLRRIYGDRLPRNAFFGDGTPIDDAAIGQISAAFDRHRWSFPWRDGDVLLVDNLAVTHGRNAFEGNRRVLVAMAGVGTAASIAQPATASSQKSSEG